LVTIGKSSFDLLTSSTCQVFSKILSPSIFASTFCKPLSFSSSHFEFFKICYFFLNFGLLINYFKDFDNLSYLDQ